MVQEVSNTLSILRLPLAIIIVFRHSEIISLNLPIALVADISLFLYFMISGYMYFRSGTLTRQAYLRKTKNRVYTLAIPYLLWMILAICFTYGDLSTYPFTNWYQWYHDFINFEGHPYNIPLWFIRDLMLISLTAPLWYWILTHIPQTLRQRGPLMLSLLIITLYITTVALDNTFFYVQGVLVFCFGGYLAIYRIDLINLAHRYFKLSTLCYLISVFAIWYMRKFLEEIPSILFAAEIIKYFAFSFMAFRIASWYKQKMRINRIAPFYTSMAFFIFCSQAIPLQLSGITLRSEKFFGTLGPVEISLGQFAITIVVSVAVYLLLYRFAPRVLNILVGGIR